MPCDTLRNHLVTWEKTLDAGENRPSPSIRGGDAGSCGRTGAFKRGVDAPRMYVWALVIPAAEEGFRALSSELSIISGNVKNTPSLQHRRFALRLIDGLKDRNKPQLLRKDRRFAD